MRLPFEDSYRVISYDLMGLGGSDRSEYEPSKYDTLQGHANDLVELIDALDLPPVVVVGHSVAAMIAVLAAGGHPDRFTALALLVPSACYIDDEGYDGGFSASDIDELLASLERNYLGWASAMAPLIMGRPDRPDLGQELTDLFCQVDPEVASQFAHATFRSDNRDDLARVRCPTLVVACRDDFVAPPEAVGFVAERIEHSTLVTLDATGHCPNLSAPDETAAAVLEFLGSAVKPALPMR